LVREASAAGMFLAMEKTRDGPSSYQNIKNTKNTLPWSKNTPKTPKNVNKTVTWPFLTFLEVISEKRLNDRVRPKNTKNRRVMGSLWEGSKRGGSGLQKIPTGAHGFQLQEKGPKYLFISLGPFGGGWLPRGVFGRLLVFLVFFMFSLMIH